MENQEIVSRNEQQPQYQPQQSNSQKNEVISMEADYTLTRTLSFLGTVHKVFGVLTIIGGVVWCLGIITAIIGIPLIIAGVKLFNSGSCFTQTTYTNDSRFLRQALVSFASYWKILIIALLVMIASYAIFIIYAMSMLSSYSRY
ncbi:DUF5362 family protein [Orbaceae bacterium ac157xtp]